MIGLPFSAKFKQKLFDMKQFGVAYFVNNTDWTIYSTKTLFSNQLIG